MKYFAQFSFAKDATDDAVSNGAGLGGGEQNPQ
jgi:hypothetical protein